MKAGDGREGGAHRRAPMQLLAGNANPELAEEIAARLGVPLTPAKIGRFVDGEVFDSSYERGVPAAMPLQALIPAWVEVLQLMRPGDEWLVTVPPEMGYGESGQGAIPPNSVLIFRIELIDVLPGPGQVQRG